MSELPTLPPGVEDTPLDAALLVHGLREIWRVAHRRRKATENDEVRALCKEVELLVQEQIDDVPNKRAAWFAMRADLLRAFRVEVVGVSDSPSRSP